MPKSNVDFWAAKINRNRQRDKRVQQELAAMGWHCMTVWECELKADRREQTLTSLEYTLNHIYLGDRTVRYSLPEDDCGMMAAETEPEYGAPDDDDGAMI
jgi:hypothetical protein